MVKSLTPKQQKFCDIYLVNGNNATQAAIDAGYSEKTACSIGNENLRKPEIKKYIGKALGETANSLKFDREAIALMMLEDRKAAQTSYRPNHGAAVKSTENLARMFGLLQDKIEQTLKGDEDNPVTFNIYIPDNSRN